MTVEKKPNALESFLLDAEQVSIVRPNAEELGLTEKGSRGYHDKLWAGKMIEVALMPTDTGQPGGKQTGYRMSDMVIEGSQFDLDCRELLASCFRLNWYDRPYLPLPKTSEDEEEDGTLPQKPKKKNRIRFSCPECALNAWAKPSAKLACGTCGLTMNSSQ